MRTATVCAIVSLLAAPAWACVDSLATSVASVRPDAEPGAMDADQAELLLHEAFQLTRENFYDPKLNGVDWERVYTDALPRARKAKTRLELGSIINGALDQLHASHTRYYTPEEREYFELLDIFNPEGVQQGMHPKIEAGPVRYVGIGAATRMIGDRVFVADVYDGGPAATAGLHVGDEIVDVEGKPFRDIAPFRGRLGIPTILHVRKKTGGALHDLPVTPARIQPHQSFLRAEQLSATLEERGGEKIAYVRVRSYAHQEFQDCLAGLLSNRLAKADGLVLDLRGGWGGANPDYLNLFNREVPRMAWKNRSDSDWTTSASTWTRPMVLLVDGGTRSGKEVFAHGFRRNNRGVVVGGKTAGAVLGGRPFFLSDGSMLFLAVTDVKVDGDRLEGVGVKPHVEITQPLPYRDGTDLELERAKDELVELIHGPPRP